MSLQSRLSARSSVGLPLVLAKDCCVGRRGSSAGTAPCSERSTRLRPSISASSDRAGCGAAPISSRPRRRRKRTCTGHHAEYLIEIIHRSGQTSLGFEENRDGFIPARASRSRPPAIPPKQDRSNKTSPGLLGSIERRRKPRRPHRTQLAVGQPVCRMPKRNWKMASRDLHGKTSGSSRKS